MYHTVGLGGVAHIADAVDGIEWSRNNGILYLGFLGILLRDGLVGDTPVEVAMVAQYGLCYTGTQLRIHP